MTKESVKDFFDAWSIYDHVLDCNYMFHQELYREVAAIVAGHYEAPFSMLDLGSGSARHLAGALRAGSVRSYVGYDLSYVALQEARCNLGAVECLLELRQGDLLEGLRAEAGPFDLIFSSFALHHLSSANKREFFRLANQRLDGGGLLLLIDVAREADQERAVYLDAYCGWMESHWTSVPRPAMELMFDHIRGNDFPETNEEIQKMAAAAGFGLGTIAAQFLWHHLWRFDRRRETGE